MHTKKGLNYQWQRMIVEKLEAYAIFYYLLELHDQGTYMLENPQSTPP